MKAKVLFPLFLLAACTPDVDSAKLNTVAEPTNPVILTDQVQKMVVETQENAISALPAEVSGYKTVEGVANRESNQRGAGFTRVYGNEAGDVMITVFVYNNQDFGVANEVTLATEALMDKHLQEIEAMQASGLYDNVSLGNKSPRELRWKGQKYYILEADASFNQRGEAKKSYIMIGGNKDLMSYIRIRYTYPRSKRHTIENQKNVFMARIMDSMANFVKDQKPQ